MERDGKGLSGWKWVLIAWGLIAAPWAWCEGNPASRLEAPSVEVVGTTPLPEIGVPVSQVPANVQAATSADLAKQQSLDLADFLNQNLGSVSVTEGQVNPFQPDVSFRGFMASPLLGAPQGLSVFVDGVRVNEAFGDVVNWDLIPPSAISSINLIPGSNPVFGLNTLGGALSINTKSGFEYPGFSAQAYAGSFGRRAAQFQWGGHGKRMDYFLTGNDFKEDGWRDHSPSRVGQLFAKAGYQDDVDDLDVSVTLANNALMGTQALPLSMLDNPRQAYTWPDRTGNDLRFLSAKASRFLISELLLAGNLYYRGLKTDSFNSNVNNNFDPTLPVAPGNAPAQNLVGKTDTQGYGGALQLTFLSDVAHRPNQLTLGLSADLADTDFSQFAQDAVFTADREAVGIDPFALTTQVNAKNRYYGVYATDTFSLTKKLHLTASGRYNRARVKLSDQLGTALSADHSFSRFNPALGLNFNPRPGLTAYAAYNEGMRVPTPVELTCADPAAPCSLPNEFLADPPLKPVISKTWEAGARGRLGQGWQWSVALFRTDLLDDILFVTNAATPNVGFFQNVPKTRRQGLELGLQGSLGKLRWAARYSYIDATFESGFIEASPSNSSRDAQGNIQVSPGDRVPGIPRHGLKLRAEYSFASGFSVGVNLIAASSQFARGDENNRDAHGQVPGYAVVNLDVHHRIDRGWELFAKVNNVFDRAYQTLGVLGENFFAGPGNTFDANNPTAEQFRSPGAPRAMWVGLRYSFGKQQR